MKNTSILFTALFSVEISKLPSNFQIECVELQSDMQLKETVWNVTLLNFYKLCLPRDQYPNFPNHA